MYLCQVSYAPVQPRSCIGAGSQERKSSDVGHSAIGCSCHKGLLSLCSAYRVSINITLILIGLTISCNSLWVS